MRKLLRYWLPVLAWAVLISVLSTSALHAGFTYRLVRSLLRFFHPDVSPATIFFVHTMVRKGAHVTEYFVFSLLLWRALRADALALWRWRWALGALALSLIFAGLDEWHQLFERGRTGSVLDVGFNTAGAVLAQFWLWWRARPSPPVTDTG